MTPKEFQQRLANMQIDIRQAIDADLPKIAGNEAARLFRRNFQEEGFFGRKWKRAKRIGKAKGAAGSRRTLTGPTGNLGRSLSVKTSPGTATITSDLPYSAVHNEGGRAGRGKGFAMPRRQFIGDSPELDKAIKKKIESFTKKIIR